MKRYFYPDLDKKDIIPQGYIAEHSGHSRGSTVDVTLVDELTGRDVDMGGPFDFFGPLSHPSHTQGLSGRQIENRMLLQRAMVRRGFRPLDTEWWHFTLQNEPFPDTYFDFPITSK